MLPASVNVFLFLHILMCPRSSPSPVDFLRLIWFYFPSRDSGLGWSLRNPPYEVFGNLECILGYEISILYSWGILEDLAMSASDQNAKNCPTVSLDPEMCPLSSLSSGSYGQILSKEARREREESLPRESQFGTIRALPVLLSDCSLWPSL